MQPSYNAALLAARTIRAASAHHDYEYERKTASNYTKEKLHSVARKTHDDVVVRGRVIKRVPEVLLSSFSLLSPQRADVSSPLPLLLSHLIGAFTPQRPIILGRHRYVPLNTRYREEDGAYEMI